MSPRISPLDNEQCRQCTSFADYIKQNRKKIQDHVSSDEGVCVRIFMYLPLKNNYNSFLRN